MKAFISTGGKGVRLYPLTKDIPKPLVPILGKPVLLHLIEWAKSYGVTEFVFMNGHLAHQIIDHFGDGSRLGVKITHSNEPYPLDSGGPIKFARKHITGPFLYLNGDQITNVNLTKMIQFHHAHKPDITLFANPVSPENTTSDTFHIDENSRVIKFVSKWDDRTHTGNLANRGLCIIEPTILKLMDQEKFNFENYIFPKALTNGYKMMVYHTEEFNEDMGTPERFKKCEEFLRRCASS